MRMAARPRTWASRPATTRTTATSISSTPPSPTTTMFSFRMTARASFTDVSYQAGIAAASMPFVGFGDGFLDYDNDGWKDLLIVNGHVYPEVDQAPGLGHQLCPAPAAVPQSARTESLSWCPRSREPGLPTSASAAAPHLATLQRRQDRRGHQQYGRRSGAASQRESRPPPLGRAEAHRGTEEPARCGRSDGLSDRRRHAPARRRAQRRQLSLLQRSARSLWPGRCDRRRRVEIHWPSGRGGKGEAARRWTASSP